MAFLVQKQIDKEQYRYEVDLYTYLNLLYKSKREQAYFFVSKGINGEWAQYSFHISEIDKAFEMIVKSDAKDIYSSINLFSGRQRVSEKVAQIPALIIDLDYYKSDKYIGYKPLMIIEELEKRFFSTNKIMYPNAIVNSGGGIYLVWLLKYTPAIALQKRKVVMKILYEMLKEFGADAKALDHSHVFRLPNTYNSKYHKEVKAYFNDLDDYTLTDIARQLPSLWDVWQKENNFKPCKPTKHKAQVKPIHKARTIAYDYMTDIFRLVDIRKGECSGYREMMCFLVRNFYHSMHKKRFYEKDTSLYDESLEVAQRLNEKFKDPISERELINTTLNVKKLYRFKIETLIEWLGIDLEEQIQLKVKTKEAKNEKSKRQMRELRSSVSREEYEKTRRDYQKSQLVQVQQILEQNPNIRKTELAQMLGISRRHLYRFLDLI